MPHARSTPSSPQQPGLGRVDERENTGRQPQNRSKKCDRSRSRGRIKLPASGRGEKQAVVSASSELEGGSSPGVIDGSDAELQIMLRAGSRASERRAPGPREERPSPRSGWLAGALPPTLGFMGLPLSGSV